MSYVRHFLYHSTGALFKLLLIILPVLFATSLVLSNPANVEKALKESRIYEEFVPLVLDESQKNTQDPQAKQLLATPEIQNAAKEAFPPDTLEKSASSFIDGIYAWLEGKTATPEFRIDLSDSKDDLAQGIASYATKRTESLPVCSIEQLRTLGTQDNLLSIPCRPPGFSSTQAGEQFSRQLLTEADFLEDPIITQDTVKSENGQPLGANLQHIPAAYQAAQFTKWIIVMATFAVGAALIFLRKDRLAGMKHVAWALVGASTFIVVALIAYWFFFGQVNKSPAASEPMQAILFDGAQVITRELNKILVWFAAGYVVLAGGLFLFIRTKRPGAQTPEQYSSDSALEKPQGTTTEEQETRIV